MSLRALKKILLFASFYGLPLFAYNQSRQDFSTYDPKGKIVKGKLSDTINLSFWETEILIDSFITKRPFTILHPGKASGIPLIAGASVEYSLFDSTFSIFSETSDPLSFGGLKTHFSKFITSWGFYDSFGFSNSSANVIECNNSSFKELGISFDTIGNMTFNSCRFDTTPVVIQYSKFNGNIEFRQCVLPKEISFFQTEISGNILIDPSDFRTEDVIIKIDKLFPIDKLKIRYSTFKLQFDSLVDDRTKLYFLEHLVATQKIIGSDKDIQKAEIELNDFKVAQGDIPLFFQKYLWLYGFDHTLLLRNIFFCFLLFFGINLFVFSKLIAAYPLENIFAEYTRQRSFSEKRNRIYKYPILVFLFSTIIFFGIKMDVLKFNLKNTFLVLYIFLFYLIGLISLFYVLGLILAK